MKCGARVALGVAGGYFLGRTKKMKLALMLGGMAAGRQAGGPAALLGQGKRLIDASPELSRLSDELKGRLFEAGKGAALAVATRQVESLTDRVAGRVASTLESVGSRAQPPQDRDDAGDDLDEADSAHDDAYDDQDSGQTTDEDDADREPAVVGARSGSDDDAESSGRSRGRADAGRTSRSAKGAARAGTRRAAGAASGGKRTADKAAGRPARARRDDDA